MRGSIDAKHVRVDDPARGQRPRLQPEPHERQIRMLEENLNIPGAKISIPTSQPPRPLARYSSAVVSAQLLFSIRQRQRTLQHRICSTLAHVRGSPGVLNRRGREYFNNFLGATADRAGEEMRINFANAIELWFYFGAFEPGALECIPPMISREETGIGTKLRISVNFSKAIQNLKHQFRIHRLIETRPDTFADYQPSIRRKCLPSLT